MGKKGKKNKVPGMKSKGKAKKAKKAKIKKNSDSTNSSASEDTTCGEIANFWNSMNSSASKDTECAEIMNFWNSEELQGSGTTVEKNLDSEDKECGETSDKKSEACGETKDKKSEACGETTDEKSDNVIAVMKCDHHSHKLPRPRFPRLNEGQYDAMLPTAADFPYHRPIEYHYCTEFAIRTYIFNACSVVDDEMCVMFTVMLSDEALRLSCLPTQEPNILCPRDKFSYERKPPGQVSFGKVYDLGESQTYHGLVYEPFLTLGRYLELTPDSIPEDFPTIIKGCLYGILDVYAHFGFADVCDASLVVHNNTGKLLCPRSTPNSTMTLAAELKIFGGSLRRLTPEKRPEELIRFADALNHTGSALQQAMLPFHPYLFSPYEKVYSFIPWLHRFAKHDVSIRLQLKKITNDFPPWRQKVRELDDSYQEIKACLDFKFPEEKKGSAVGGPEEIKACLDFKFAEEKKESALGGPEDESKYSLLAFLRNCVIHLDDHVRGRSRFLVQPELFLDFIDIIAKNFLVQVFHDIYNQGSVFL